MSDDKILVTKQISGMLSCSDQTVRRLFRQGKLPGAFKMGGQGSPIKMPASALDALRKKR